MGLRAEQLHGAVSVRPGAPEDEAFIYSSWLHSYRSTPRVRDCPSRVYYGYHHGLIERIFGHPDTEVLCAVARDDRTRIYGWICYAQANVPVVHYCYTKDAYRGLGLCRALCAAVGIDAASTVLYTWRSAAALHVAAKIVKVAEYLPVEEYLSTARSMSHENQAAS